MLTVFAADFDKFVVHLSWCDAAKQPYLGVANGAWAFEFLKLSMWKNTMNYIKQHTKKQKAWRRVQESSGSDECEVRHEMRRETNGIRLRGWLCFSCVYLSELEVLNRLPSQVLLYISTTLLIRNRIRLKNRRDSRFIPEHSDVRREKEETS